MILLLLVWLWIQVKAWFARGLRRKRKSRVHGLALITPIRVHAKPAWVVREVIRLKALMPDAGCRSTANIFNRRYAVSRKMTVGKSFVADTIRRHRYQIEVLRRKLKHRVPRAMPKNWMWGLDLTGKTDGVRNLHMIFGLIDHGSRALLSLGRCRINARGHCLAICFWLSGNTVHRAQYAPTMKRALPVVCFASCFG